MNETEVSDAPRVRRMVNPCRCGHEKGDHQMRIGQRGNYTPCNRCKTCDAFRKLDLRHAALLVVRAANAVGRPCGSDEVDAAIDALAAVLAGDQA